MVVLKIFHPRVVPFLRSTEPKLLNLKQGEYIGLTRDVKSVQSSKGAVGDTFKSNLEVKKIPEQK